MLVYTPQFHSLYSDLHDFIAERVILFLIISVVALLLAISLLRNLISNVTLVRKTLKSEEQKLLIDEWMKIPTSLNYALMGVLGLSIYTVYRQF